MHNAPPPAQISIEMENLKPSAHDDAILETARPSAPAPFPTRPTRAQLDNTSASQAPARPLTAAYSALIASLRSDVLPQAQPHMPGLPGPACPPPYVHSHA